MSFFYSLITYFYSFVFFLSPSKSIYIIYLLNIIYLFITKQKMLTDSNR